MSAAVEGDARRERRRSFLEVLQALCDRHLARTGAEATGGEMVELVLRARTVAVGRDGPAPIELRPGEPCRMALERFLGG